MAPATRDKVATNRAQEPHRLAIGIDLGTTNSLVASVIDGKAMVLRDEDARALLPSVVRYLAPAEGAHPVVGHEAKRSKIIDPRNTLVSIKRLIGRCLEELDFAKILPYVFVESKGMAHIKTAAGIKNPVDVSADILRTLCQRAEAVLDGDLVGAVITVPAHFDDAQRQATKDAAHLVGLKVLRLLNEPTAAAIAYGLDKGAEGTYAVYDLGGGTFDISILKLTRGVFDVLATRGDSFLGGDDFDYRIRDWIISQVEIGEATISAKDERHLLDQARLAKKALSAEDATSFFVTLGEDRTYALTLTREMFHSLVNDLVIKTIRSVSGALRDAGLSTEEIDGVVLVGGATRMPMVQAAVADFFGQTPRTDIDPDQAVAIGAAIQADVLAGNRSGDEWLLLDVCPLSLGLEMMGGITEKIIERNTTIPAVYSQDFTTYKDGQTAMKIHVVQGERELVDHCRSLAKFELCDIPSMVAGAAKVRVTFQIDADGLLNVSAREMLSGAAASVDVKPSYGLDDAAVSRMLQDLDKVTEEDRRVRVLREARLNARCMIDVTQAALRENGDTLLSASERKRIERHIHRLSEILATGDEYKDGNIQALSATMVKLDMATREFAARRMDASFHRALAGQTVEQLAEEIF